MTKNKKIIKEQNTIDNQQIYQKANALLEPLTILYEKIRAVTPEIIDGSFARLLDINTLVKLLNGDGKDLKTILIVFVGNNYFQSKLILDLNSGKIQFETVNTSQFINEDKLNWAKNIMAAIDEFNTIDTTMLTESIKNALHNQKDKSLVFESIMGIKESITSESDPYLTDSQKDQFLENDEALDDWFNQYLENYVDDSITDEKIDELKQEFDNDPQSFAEKYTKVTIFDSM